MERDDFHASILVQLGDDAGDRFGSSLLDEVLRQALTAYNQTAPRLLTGTVTLSAAGQLQPLAGLSGLLEVVEVVFPYDAAASSLPAIRPAVAVCLAGWQSPVVAGRPTCSPGR